MLLRRIYQFFIIYLLGIALLFALKYTLRLSDYVIPGPAEIWRTGRDYAGPYLLAVLNTLAVAILGHLLSICLATAVAVLGRLTAWIGSFIRTAAYNIQAYPIVAVAPIIFILLGDGLALAAVDRRHDLLFPAAALLHRNFLRTGHRHRALLQFDPAHDLAPAGEDPGL